MRTVLGLIVIAIAAYLGTALFKIARLPSWLRDFGVSGLSFFGLGFLLGPHATALLDGQVLAGLDVLVNLGVGWVGLLFGLQFSRHDLARLQGRLFLAAATETLLTLTVLGTGIWLAVLPSLHARPDWLVVVVLATIGSTTSPTVAAQTSLALRSRGPVTNALRVISSIDALPAIAILGVVFCFSDLHPAGVGLLDSGWLWVIASGALGLMLGALLHFLTLYRYTDNQLLVVILGAVIFSGGVSHYLLMSPLFINLIVGMVVANRSPQRSRVLGSLLRVEKPIYLILLTLAGSMWRLPPLSFLALVPIFIILRTAGKLVGGACAGRLSGLGGPLGIGPGLLPHGGMALVLALNVKQFFPGALGDLALTAAVGSMLVATLIGPWALGRLLKTQGETA